MLPTESNEELVVIDVDQCGRITAIYDDSLHEVFVALGSLRRPRASEINEDPLTGLFVADLRLSGGPILPGKLLKRDVEQDEVHWLLKNKVGFDGQVQDIFVHSFEGSSFSY